jgi:hypothetical protein
MKIRVVHLLIDTESERERKSIESMSKLQDYGIDYIQYITKRYNNDAWKFQEPYDGWVRHGPGHYGAFMSFKDIILKYFTDDLDAFIFLEADCVLHEHMNMGYFYNQIEKSIEFCNKHNVYNFSFGHTHYNNVIQSEIIKIDDNYQYFYLTNKIIGAHCRLFPKKTRELLLKELIFKPWDAIDIWLNKSFYENRQEFGLNLGINKQPHTYQHEGMSMIDGDVKNTKYNL